MIFSERGCLSLPGLGSYGLTSLSCLEESDAKWVVHNFSFFVFVLFSLASVQILIILAILN